MTKGKKTTEKTIDNKEHTKKKKESVKKEHKVVVDTMETVKQNDDELTNRINRLYGMTSEEIKEEKHYDPKELEEIRKKLILLLIGVIICGVVVLVILVNPFDFEINSTSGNNDAPVEEEQESTEQMPLGAIDTSNSTVVELNNFVSFSASDFENIDLFPLYASDVIESKDIPNNIKLYLLKRHEAFLEMLDNANIEEYIETCDTNGLVITKEKFDGVVSKVLGSNVTVEYNDINYAYYSSILGVKKITMSYASEEYLIKCNDYTQGGIITKFIQQNLNKAVKVENAIEIYQNIVFINETGVYKDPKFTQLITNDTNAVFNDYISSGVIYKYTFTEDGENYYLTKIEKVIETSN